MRLSRLTGGCSSIFSPASGFAARFANTPSEPDPPPYILVLLGAKTGNTVGRLSSDGGGASAAASDGDRSADGDACAPLINLCLSSPSFSSSLSAPSASKVSARVRSTGRLCRDVIEEARDRKEGGGELGVCSVIGECSSFSATCGRY